MTDSVEKTTLHQIRRSNLLLLLRIFTEEQLAKGAAAKGIEGAFAAHLNVSKSTLSHLKSSRNISNKVAQQIEACIGKETGWMDLQHGDHSPTAAELHFLEMARSAWHSTNAAGRRRLLKLAQTQFIHND